MSARSKANRGVYSFCMCPGGTVVPAASEKGRLCTNGMSEFLRNGENANSALLVDVRPEDLGEDMLSGIAFQRELEEKAYRLGGGGLCCAGSAFKGFYGKQSFLRPWQRAADIPSRRQALQFA